VTALLLLGTAAGAGASQLSEFHGAIAQAYGFYRSAVFYLRTGNTMVAGFELEQMRERWRGVRERYAGAPPDAYADDPRFARALADIAGHIESAAAAAADGDAGKASAALAPVHDTLAQLRRRAGVRVFSDCVDELNAAMDALYAYRHQRPDLADVSQANDVKAKAAVLRYLVRRCDGAADRAVREDDEFRRLIDGMLVASDAMFEAVDRKDTTAVVNLIRELRSFDRILFLRFG
jgi:uncharacterized protein YukE